MSYYLWCDFGRDGDGTLNFAPKKNVENMEEYYCSMFRSKPKLRLILPLEKGDHPELDTYEHLD